MFEATQRLFSSSVYVNPPDPLLLSFSSFKLYSFFVLRFTLTLYFQCGPCYLYRDDIDDVHLLPKHESSSEPGFWEENKSLCLFPVWDDLYLHLNGAITFAGESHLACHNDTQGIATLLWQQHRPDHNETAVLYLGMFGKKQSITTLRRLP